MCGFVGYVYGTTVGRGSHDLIAASDALAHRGPDGRGALQESWFGLAHRRLSIIDVSTAAAQPMCDVSGRYALVFNGEIYNFRDLHRKYLHDVVGVNGNSDSSVLLYLFAQLGTRCVSLLDGMFAFVVVDKFRKTMFAARDRFGEKPLYWRVREGCIEVASELGALRELTKGEDWSVSDDAELLYHCMGSVPAPFTIIRGVNALRAGHHLSFGEDGVSEECYWELPTERVPADSRPNIGIPSAREEVRRLLISAVSSRLVSDVPVGLFLSGGYDSGAIASVLSLASSQQVQGLCVEFPEQEYSEAHLAQQTANEFGVPLSRAVIDAQSFLGGLDGFFDHMDQPTADGYNTYFVCKAAKELGIKVWLSGVGGDEIFGGYPSFSRISKVERLARILTIVPNSLVEECYTLFERSPRLQRILHLADRGDATVRAYQVLRNVISLRTARRVLHRSAPRICDDFETLDCAYPLTRSDEDRYQRASRLELSVYMRSLLLRDIDNFGMANSLELRAPFLSHELVESVVALPMHEKYVKGKTKSLLAQAMPRQLPKVVLNQGKRGFTFPIATWLDKHLRESFESVVSDPRSQSFWTPDEVRKIWQQHELGRIGWAPVWQLYAYARWRLLQ